MATYDSDSSGGEDNDYTETNVLLGYASKEPSDDIISQLGGRPAWLDPTTPPSAALARCKVCKDLMVLLLQLNGDLPEHFPGHERRLYVLTCRRKTCRRKEGSVRAIRGTRINEAAAKDIKKEVKKEDKPVQPVAKVVESKGLGESLFGAKPLLGTAGSNPFSASSTGAKPANPFASPSTAPNNPFSASNLSELAAKPPQNPTTTTTTAENLPKTFAAALSLNNTRAKPEMFGPIPPPEPWPQDSDLPAPYPSYYIADADYETLDKEDAPVPQAIMMDVDDGSTGGGGGKEDTEIYESTIDKTFQKFADRLAQNPEQVIRYEFRGAPLVYSKTDAVGRLLSSPQSGSSKITTTSGGGNRVPRCTNCGAGRVFEVQLTPHAILELEAEEMGLEGMEWGTILLEVCEKDCLERGKSFGEVGHVEEWVGVQWEEVTERRA